MAASVEASSEHSIGRAFFTKAKEKNASLSGVENFSALPGLGVQGDVNGKTVAVGGPQLLATKGIAIPQSLKDKIVGAESNGKTINYVFENNTLAGVITSADVVREETKEAVKALKGMGVRVAIAHRRFQSRCEVGRRSAWYHRILRRSIAERQDGEGQGITKGWE